MDTLSYKLRNMIKKILTDQKTKFMTFGFGLVGVHSFLAIVFACVGYKPLFIYNLLSVAFYLYFSLVLIAKGRYIQVYISLHTEIVLCAMLSTYLVGKQCGFLFYMICLIPVAYYLAFAMPGVKRVFAVPVAMSAFLMLCGLGTDMYMAYQTTTVKHVIPFLAETVLYYFNITLVMAMLIIFSALFSMEMYYRERAMKEENSLLESIANTDPLTRLLNRRSMNRCLRRAYQEAVEGNSTFCVIMSDIDDFKKINDEYGHEMGDEILKSVAATFRESVREQDVICRWGGEEILVLVKNNLECAVSIAERVRHSIMEKRYHADSQEFSVTVTMGVAAYREGATIESTIDDADNRMYAGKNSGKNQVIY